MSACVGLVCFLWSILVPSHPVVLHYHSVQHAERKLILFILFSRAVGDLTLSDWIFGMFMLGFV